MIMNNERKSWEVMMMADDFDLLSELCDLSNKYYIYDTDYNFYTMSLTCGDMVELLDGLYDYRDDAKREIQLGFDLSEEDEAKYEQVKILCNEFGEFLDSVDSI